MKVVLLFLLGMAAIALIGNAIAPGSVWRQVGRTVGMRRCPTCGKPLIGKGPCDCRRRV